jgi:Protein of unknown function (DUF3024)
LALPELTRRQVEKALTAYCGERLQAYIHDKLKLGFRFRGNSVTLYEERPALAEPGMWIEIVVAQFRFQPQDKEWTLYWTDRNSKWHPYEEVESSKNFEVLLKEVHEDPTGIFWG